MRGWTLRLASASLVVVGLAGGCTSSAIPRAHTSVRASRPASGPGIARGRQSMTPTDTPITHVIFLIKENRTFDNYFARYPGADGATSGRTSDGRTITLKVAPDVVTHDLGHEFFDGVRAIDGGRMDGFDRVLNGASLDGYSSFTRSGIPNYWAYADHFVLGDRMFSSMYGPTFPEHLYTVGAQAGRVTGNKLNVGRYSRELNGKVGAYCSDPGESIHRFRELTAAETKEVMAAEERTDTSRIDDFYQTVQPCFDFRVLPDELNDAGVSWRYYSSDSDWRNALAAIRHIRYSASWGQQRA
ncbi:MAG: hypothetical protein M3P18_17550, partial [Actinomycetota bacterium]|nr:hypothetical protein [Actinomycetota bacterium]